MLTEGTLEMTDHTKRIPFGLYYTACLALFFCVLGLFFVFGIRSAVNTPQAIITNTAPLLYEENMPNPPSTSAYAAVLIDASSGAVLYTKNAHERLPMASTTKIMTALVVLENMPLDKTVTVPEEAASIEGSSMYLRANEKVTVETLLYGLLLESGNDAAHTLAVACSGSVEAFAEKMNERAEALGLRDTHFVNPHGLSADFHYTTAYELARITAEALQNETFRQMVSTVTKVVSATDGDLTRYFSNHNKLLRQYEGAIGVKTGYTKAAGRCLVGAAERDGSTFVTVTLNDGNDWADHAALLDHAFEHYRTVTVAEPDAFGVYIHGKRLANADGIYLTVPKNKEPIFSFTAVANEDIGRVEYFADGIKLGEYAIK